MEATPLGMRPAARMMEREMKRTAEMTASFMRREDASVAVCNEVPVTGQSESVWRGYRKDCVRLVLSMAMSKLLSISDHAVVASDPENLKQPEPRARALGNSNLKLPP